MNMALQARLRFIDFCLDNFEKVNRKHLTDYFGISTPQASLDVQAYLKIAPDNLYYDATQKCYIARAGFVRQFP